MSAATSAKPANGLTDALDNTAIPPWPQYFEQHHDAQRDDFVPPPCVVNMIGRSYRPRADWNAKIKLWRGDITKLRVDAIVNAANKGLWAGAGVCGAIHAAAGRQLERECERIIDQRNGKDVEVGSAVATQAYQLNARHVFHAVGPTNKDQGLLRSAYRECLDLAVAFGCRSIAFPCISTGIFGFPNDLASLCALLEVRAWLEADTERAAQVDAVIFCIFLEKDLHLYHKHLPIFFPLLLPADDAEAVAPSNANADSDAATNLSATPPTGEAEGNPTESELTFARQSVQPMSTAAATTEPLTDPQLFR